MILPSQLRLSAICRYVIKARGTCLARPFHQHSFLKMSSSKIALTTGAPEPPPPKPGQLFLYSHRFCPFVYRVRLVLAAKKIPYEHVNIDLKNKPEWLTAKNPISKVPILEKDGNILYESAIIADYLDEAYPSNIKLLPTDPMQKAKGRILAENCGKIVAGFFGTIKSPGPESTEALTKEVQHYENELSALGTPYFNGQNPGMTDFMLWPFFELLFTVSLYHGDQGFPIEKYTAISKWSEDMQANPVVQECTVGLQNMVGYLKGTVAGEANANYGL